MDYLYLQGEIYLRDRAIEDKWIFIGNTSGATIRWESEIVSVPEKQYYSKALKIKSLPGIKLPSVGNPPKLLKLL